jgi:hypothetical protein
MSRSDARIASRQAWMHTWTSDGKSSGHSRKPAYRHDPLVVENIVQNVQDEPAGLPLLQFALRKSDTSREAGGLMSWAA